MKKQFLVAMLLMFGIQMTQAQRFTPSATLDSLMKEKDKKVLNARLDQLEKTTNKEEVNAYMFYNVLIEIPGVYDLANEPDSNVVTKRLNELINSPKEEDEMIAYNYYNFMSKGKKGDAVKAQILKKFPNGQIAFKDAMHEIFNETDGPANEKRHAAFVKRFGSNPKLKGHRFFQYVKYYVALSYSTSNPSKMAPWISKITDSIYRAKAFYYGAYELNGRGQSEAAEPLIRGAYAELKKQGRTKSYDYQDVMMTGARILLNNKKYAEGYDWLMQVYKPNGKPNPTMDKTYLGLLVGTEHYKEAYPLMEEAIRNGSATPLIKERFSSAYRTVKGDTTGYSNYYTALRKAFVEKIKSNVAKEMVNEPAFNFHITTADGKPVSLADYKGKVVVLDFWATWCGPCKASLPAMQKAVNIYKNDPKVEFLFVHTLEQSPNATQDAEKYLKANHYDMTLMMDLRDPSTKKNSAATGFALQGIPTKIVIDGNGNLRFRTAGYMGNEEIFLNELTAMVELAKRG